METGTLSKDPFLTITETANGNDLDLHIDVQDLFGEDLSLRAQIISAGLIATTSAIMSWSEPMQTWV